MTDTAEINEIDTPGAATAYIKRHDDDAKTLTRRTKNALLEELRKEFAARRIIPVGAFRGNRDELIREILEYRFPRYKEAQQLRADYVNSVNRSMMLAALASQLVQLSDEDLALVLKETGPWSRRRLVRVITEQGYLSEEEP